jgi:hypothetical protein
VNSTLTLTPNSDFAAFGIILCQDGCVAFAYENNSKIPNFSFFQNFEEIG